MPTSIPPELEKLLNPPARNHAYRRIHSGADAFTHHLQGHIRFVEQAIPGQISGETRATLIERINEFGNALQHNSANATQKAAHDLRNAFTDAGLGGCGRSICEAMQKEYKASFANIGPQI